MQSCREEILIMSYDQQHLKSFTAHHYTGSLAPYFYAGDNDHSIFCPSHSNINIVVTNVP